jgi:hypothetical protein
MKRALVIAMLFSFFALAFIPGDVSGGPCSNSLSPPFISSGVKPNILIVLDNSNSFDEDFYGNAVGSYSSASKSVIARLALQNLVTELQTKANVGIMTFTLPGDVTSSNLHNSMPFASYDPASYCPNAPADCATYCTTGDSTAKLNCDTACGTGFTSHTFASTGTNFPDLILSTSVYPFTTDLTSIRARYCGLIYPKTQSRPNPTDSSHNIYYNQPDAMYSNQNLGTLFSYCGSDAGSSYAYSPAEYANNEYILRGSKTGTTDVYDSSYGGVTYSGHLTPTDSDYALGFYNFGQRLPWYYVGPTWLSQSSVGSPQGYLNVKIGDLTNSTQYNNVENMLNPNLNNSSGYMSCNQSNMNKCSYIVNAGNTPTAGTLQTAFNYFNGTYAGQSTPITATCQKNYVIFVTDGLPDTMLDGSMPSSISTIMPQVLTQLSTLQTGVSALCDHNGHNCTNFPIKTYVLGVGLTATAKTNADQMAVSGGTVQPSGHAYYADNPSQLTDALENIIQDLLARVAAGSSISILSEGQSQNGDNMLQGVFYPNKYFGTTTVSWPGYLYNYWFYNSATYNNIREDTIHDYILELDQDYGLSFEFDTQLGLSINRYSDPTGSGNPSVFVDNVGLDALSPVWEAGKLLFQATAAGRTIYTPGSGATGLVSFDSSNATLTTPASSPLGNPSATPATFDPCLQGSSGTVTLQNLINYVRGTDLATCRNRTAGLCSNGTAFNNTPCGTNSDCTGSSYSTCTKNVWKLGDIVYSTPRVQTDYKYCYNGSLFNTQLCSQNSDCTTGAYTTCQKKESVVFVGANDGMLHAFKTGILSTQGMNATQHQIETLTGIATTDMGKELWGFIPKNSLPYLRCLAVPPPSSCHLYYNDLSPYITTMVAGGVSKTVLIGGMRLGGGTVDSPPPTDTCASMSCSNAATCYNPANCTGLSSYYALDITDVENPKLLWEFSHPYLGYSYSGPAVIHKWSNATNLSGDQYYVMFLSGPTVTDGSSSQDVQAFVLTLNASLGISSLYYQDFGNTTKNGFGGRLFTSGLDVNADGYTDFVFFGYGSSPNGKTANWQGGIAKINTNNSNATLAMSPSNWTWDVSTYNNIAQLPITAQVATEQCFGNWYLYTGSGRYFFPQDAYGSSGSANFIMGVPFTCDQYNNNCGPNINSTHNNSTACADLQAGNLPGASWKYSLNSAAGTFLAERMITDPTVSTGNKIYMTTSEPTSDPCGYGGQSRVWGLNCGTGTAISDQSCTGYAVTDPTGTLYLQTSTGAVYRIDAASSFTDSSTANRTTPWFIGMPPENAPPVVQPAASAAKTGQLLQWIEK